MKLFVGIGISLCLLISCANSSIEKLQKKGEEETRKLAILLHEIDTKEDLQNNLPELKKRFYRFAELIISVRKLEIKTKKQDPTLASDQLFAELARLYEMPGCRDLIEEAQGEAVKLLNGR